MNHNKAVEIISVMAVLISFFCCCARSTSVQPFELPEYLNLSVGYIGTYIACM